MKLSVLFALTAVASAVGFAEYQKTSSPGSDVRIPKSATFQKVYYERIWPEGWRPGKI